MSLQHLLPCTHCGHKLEVVARQAGQDLECPQCKQVVEVPMLGKMKQLEVVGGIETANRPARTGGNLRNLLFVVGVTLAVLGGASGYFLQGYAKSLIFEIDYDEQLEIFCEQVDMLSPWEVVALYDEMKIESGLGEWYEPNFVRYNTQGAILLKISFGLIALSGLGLLLLLGSFFVKR